MAAASWRPRDSNLESPEVTLDRSQVCAAVLSERHFRSSGLGGTQVGFAPLSRFWRTADGWVRTHANYPWHKIALLQALGVRDDPGHIASALGELPSEAVEDRVFEAGGVAAAVRPLGEWRAHAQGNALASEPLIGHLCLGRAEPRTRGALAGLPASGIRVLDLTRVIAGPVCTRFLGALGADVLRVDPPGHPDMPEGVVADTLLAKRSAVLDFARPGGLVVLHELLDEADVLVCGYRPGSLEAFGLGAEEIADRHPGLVVVYLAAWGHTGPWAKRRGFDSVVQAPTGIAVGESVDGDAPGALPCQLLDHGTGYLAAAAILDGLRRQSIQGGTYIRRLSLARTARWLTSSTSRGQDPVSSEAAPDARRWRVELRGADTTVRAVAPPGSLAGRALRWPGPPTRYLSDALCWTP